MKKDLCSVADLNQDEIYEVFNLSAELKKKLKQGEDHLYLKNKILAMIFEKPSLRTRCTFHIGMYQLGGEAIYLSPAEVGINQREGVHDIAKNLERWCNLLIARTFQHKTIEDFAHFCSLPVINGLSDLEHPCQALTDFFTLLEYKGKLEGLNLTFVGDGNNICNSLLLLSSLLGVNMTVACPEGFEPPRKIVEKAKAFSLATGSIIQILHNPGQAVKNADAIYTDVWASMGQEKDSEQRKKHFKAFQVNSELISKAPSGVIIMHDLPAHRGEEITDEVIDSEQSIVFEQAENRLHVQKAIMVYLYKKMIETS